MLSPPPELPDDPAESRKYADWVELACFIGGSIAREDVEAALRDEVFFADPMMEPGADTPTERLVDDIKRHLDDRAIRLAGGYPFELSNQLIEMRPGTGGEDWPGYLFLLLLDVGRFYPALDRGTQDPNGSPKLFEEIVAASLRAFKTSTTVRFGAPFGPSWPPGREERFQELSERMGVGLIRPGIVDGQIKDKGVDVLARLDLGDDHGGSPILLTQCTVSQRTDWMDKVGEPPITWWNELLAWDAPLQRVFAVPLAFERPNREYSRYYRELDGATTLDRRRLTARNFEGELGDVRTEVADWCHARLEELEQYMLE